MRVLGYKCIAAPHVRENLGISFACMQADMTGQSATKGFNLPCWNRQQVNEPGQGNPNAAPNGRFQGSRTLAVFAVSVKMSGRRTTLPPAFHDSVTSTMFHSS